MLDPLAVRALLDESRLAGLLALLRALAAGSCLLLLRQLCTAHGLARANCWSCLPASPCLCW